MGNMQIDTTSTMNIDVSGATFGKILNHVRHEENQEHSNKDINSDFTKFDIERHFNGKEWTKENSNYWKQKLVNDEVKPFIKKYNDKLDQKHKYRAYKNADDYLQRCKGEYDRRAIVTLGNQETAEQMFLVVYSTIEQRALNAGHGLSDDEVTAKTYQIYNEIFKTYVDEFNLHNEPLEITDYVTNLDEGGAPHMHFRLMQYGTDRKGKPVLNMTKSIKKSMHVSGKMSNKQVMSQFRSREDKRLIECANDVFHQNGIDLELNLIRLKPSETGLSMEDYKMKKRVEQLEQEKEELKNKVDELENNQSHVRGATTRVKNDNKKLRSENKKLIEENQKIKQENKVVKSENDKLKQDNQQMTALQAENNNLRKMNNRLENTIKQLRQRVDRVKNWFEMLPKRHYMENGLKMLALHNNARNTLRAHNERMQESSDDRLAERIETSLENRGWKHGMRAYNNEQALSKNFHKQDSFESLDDETQYNLMTLGMHYANRKRGKFGKNQKQADSYAFEQRPTVEYNYVPDAPIVHSKKEEDDLEL